MVWPGRVTGIGKEVDPALHSGSEPVGSGKGVAGHCNLKKRTKVG